MKVITILSAALLLMLTLTITACADSTNFSVFEDVVDPYMAFSVTPGNYYLDGNDVDGTAYIQIIDSCTLRFINFDIDYLANYLLIEGTDYTGKDAEDFMNRHNLPDVFNKEIEFEYNEDDNFIYVKALSNSNEPDNGESYITVYYRMECVDNNTLIFIENEYIRIIEMVDEYVTV